MSNLVILNQYAQRRAQGALQAWQRLKGQCEEARYKLSQLYGHGNGYRHIMQANLEQGMSAGSTLAHLGFIGQIEAVAVRQKAELTRLEEACAHQWRELVEARREERMYEILSERVAARKAAADSRRRQVEIDELLQRAIAPGQLWNAR